ncbi:hypothetical protein SSA02_01900 [Swaminathania salitolerans]|uniref:Uncharacterized protein n=1 Tax=Swaminathania salitolerans TaxID=182838 RepID=A0A511BL12_9PROT|nr:hypothetical protein SSA02_01900 [Swaminathania salitolerans]
MHDIHGIFAAMAFDADAVGLDSSGVKDQIEALIIRALLKAVDRLDPGQRGQPQVQRPDPVKRRVTCRCVDPGQQIETQIRHCPDAPMCSVPH